MNNLVTLNSTNLHALSGSPSGSGFTREQIELLGVQWPAPKGWLKRLIGKTITRELYDRVKASCRTRWVKDEGIVCTVPFPDAAGTPCAIENDIVPDTCVPVLAIRGPVGEVLLDRSTAAAVAQLIYSWMVGGDISVKAERRFQRVRKGMGA